MCVEGLRAIPLGCSDCYDKDNVPEACAWRVRQRAWWWAARGRGRGLDDWGLTARAGLVLPVAPRTAQAGGMAAFPEQLLSKHLGCCDRAVHHPGL